MKYMILRNDGSLIGGITIDPSAKEDFKEMMKWTEADFVKKTIIVY